MKWYVPLCLAVGIAIGAVAVMVLPFLQPSYSELLAAKTQLREQDSELADLRGQVQKLQRQADAVEEIASTAPPPASRPVASSSTEPGEKAKPTPNPMMELGLQMMKQQLEGKLAALKMRLNLTPEQAAQVEAYFRKRVEYQMGATRATMAGDRAAQKESMRQMAALGTEDSVLGQILDPEQQEVYKAYQEEERTQTKQLMALHETNRISSLFPLSEEQKDRVYAIYYEQPPVTSDDTQPKSALEMQSQRTEAIRTKLQEVLTPEQLDVWMRQQESENAMRARMIEQAQGK